MGRLATRHNVFLAQQRNWTANDFGSSITPGASDANGSWVDLFGNTTDEDSWGIWLTFTSGSGSNTDTLCDIGVDTAGGTSYSVVIPNLIAGYAAAVASTTTLARTYFFPIFIPKGSTVAARAQQGLSTVVSFKLRCRLLQKPTHPELMKCGTFVEDIGTNSTTSKGVSITPGASKSWGSWTSIGSPTRDAFYWHGEIGIASARGQNYLADWGVGDGTTFRTLLEAQTVGTGSGQNSAEWIPAAWRYATLPAGAGLYCRIQGGDGTLDPCYGAIYVVGGFGGV